MDHCQRCGKELSPDDDTYESGENDIVSKTTGEVLFKVCNSCYMNYQYDYCLCGGCCGLHSLREDDDPGEMREFNRRDIYCPRTFPHYDA